MASKREIIERAACAIFCAATQQGYNGWLYLRRHDPGSASDFIRQAEAAWDSFAEKIPEMQAVV